MPCLGGKSTEQVQAWRDKIKWYLETRYPKDLDRTDGEPMEFEWKIQKMMAELRCDPEHFQGRIIFISMYIDIEWWTPGNKENCVANSANVATCAKKFPQGCWSFLGPCCEKKWYETHISKPNGEWDKTAEDMMLNFAESGHPVFRATSASERTELKKKQSGWKEVHSLQREVKKPSNRFFALLFLSISSLSTEQSQICAKN